MKVHWTNRAKARLKQIHEYIQQDSARAADNVVRRLVARSIQIGNHPDTGREVPEHRRDDIREILERPYRIIYIVKASQIDILSVVHYRQLLPDDLKLKFKK